MELGFVNAYGKHEDESSQRLRYNNGQDKISDLPNHIIGSILSFLPAKEAVSTCVLFLFTMTIMVAILMSWFLSFQVEVSKTYV